MTSRQRVSTLLGGGISDRIPNGFGESETSGLHIMAYDKFCRAVNLNALPPPLCCIV